MTVTNSWLGLAHTFEQILTTTQEDDPCNPEEVEFNDFVDDTPMQSGASDVVTNSSCTEFLNNAQPLPDTCPDLPGRDPMFNYMNYVDSNICWELEGEFTCQQVQRMYAHWILFRDPVQTCPDPIKTAELEIIFVLDEAYTDDFVTIELATIDGDVIFDSLTDHFFYFNAFPDVMVLELDLCVPREQIYTVTVRDNLGENGFTDGVLEIYVDGVLTTTIEDNFGKLIQETIQPISATEPPTMAPTSGSVPRASGVWLALLGAAWIAIRQL